MLHIAGVELQMNQSLVHPSAWWWSYLWGTVSRATVWRPQTSILQSRTTTWKKLNVLMQFPQLPLNQRLLLSYTDKVTLSSVWKLNMCLTALKGPLPKWLLSSRQLLLHGCLFWCKNMKGTWNNFLMNKTGRREVGSSGEGGYQHNNEDRGGNVNGKKTTSLNQKPSFGLETTTRQTASVPENKPDKK